MGGAGGQTGGDGDGDRNHQHGDAGFCTFICSAKPLSNRFFGVLICFGAGLGLISYGTIVSSMESKDYIQWQRFMYIGIGIAAILSGAVGLGKLCAMYRSFRRHQEQQGQNFALQGNLDPQQPQVWTTGQYTTPYPSFGPGQPPPGYAATVGPQYPTWAYPQQQPYPPAAAWGAVPSQQQPPPVQTGLSDGTSQASYPSTAHAQEQTTDEPLLPPPPTYDEVVTNKLQK